MVAEKIKTMKLCEDEGAPVVRVLFDVIGTLGVEDVGDAVVDVKVEFSDCGSFGDFVEFGEFGDVVVGGVVEFVKVLFCPKTRCTASAGIFNVAT